MADAKKILVVDDEPMNIKLLTAILVPAGYNVINATRGNEAIQLTEKEHPDIVLLDLLMPGMDGFQACKTMRTQFRSMSFAIIILTAKDDENDIKHALEQGADDYILKPINAKELLKKISVILSLLQNGMLPSSLYYKKQNETL